MYYLLFIIKISLLFSYYKIQTIFFICQGRSKSLNIKKTQLIVAGKSSQLQFARIHPHVLTWCNISKVYRSGAPLSGHMGGLTYIYGNTRIHLFTHLSQWPLKSSIYIGFIFFPLGYLTWCINVNSKLLGFTRVFGLFLPLISERRPPVSAGVDYLFV